MQEEEEGGGGVDFTSVILFFLRFLRKESRKHDFF